MTEAKRRLRALLVTLCVTSATAVHAEPGTSGGKAAAPDVGKPGRAGIRWVTIPAGSFTMGCTAGDGDCVDRENPPHRVTLTRGFEMAATETTNAQYTACVEAGVCDRPSRNTYNDLDKVRLPVVWVSWEQATCFCRWAGGRLPTEAEWEYAARGGREGHRYPGGNEIDASQARYGKTGTAPVGSYEPNAFGLFDMAGNVWEWCSDWYDEGYYASSPERDPAGPPSGSERVLRGGSEQDVPRALRVSMRHSNAPIYHGSRHGFRCVRDLRSR